MCSLEFTIPFNRENLLEENSADGEYRVRSVVAKEMLRDELKRAEQAYRADGPLYILEHFDTHYSVLTYESESELAENSLRHLAEACCAFSGHLEVILQEKLTAEGRRQNANALKMLTYLLSMTAVMAERSVEQRNERNVELLLKRKKGAKRTEREELSEELKCECLCALDRMVRQPVCRLWEPPVCEELFAERAADACFAFLQNPNAKANKESTRMALEVLGTLSKDYYYSKAFAARSVQLLTAPSAKQNNDHLEEVLPAGAELLANEFNCRGLVGDLVERLTEWQVEHDGAGDQVSSRRCGNALAELAARLPRLILPEVPRLERCLHHESAALRTGVLCVARELLQRLLSRDDMTDDERESRDSLLGRLLEHVLDTNAHVRAKVLQLWSGLLEEQAVPISLLGDVLAAAVSRLDDRSSLVRKQALALIAAFLRFNPWAAELNADAFERELESESENETRIESEWRRLESELRSVAVAPPDWWRDVAERTVEPTEVANLLRDGRLREALTACAAAHAVPLRVVGAGEATALLLTAARQAFVGEGAQAAAQAVYLKDALRSLRLLDSAMPRVARLILSTCQSDVAGALDFLAAARHFGVRGADDALRSALALAQSPEPERRRLLADAYLDAYLPSESSVRQRADALIALQTSLSCGDRPRLAVLVSGWSQDNVTAVEGLPEALWARVARDERERAAAFELLAAFGNAKPAIVERNLRLLTEIGLGSDEPTVVVAACRAACCLRGRLAIDDPLWRAGREAARRTGSPEVASALLRLAYAASASPDALAERLVRDAACETSRDLTVESLARLARLLGEVAARHLVYLDADVYGELRRRNRLAQPVEGADDLDADYVGRVCETELLRSDRLLGHFAPMLERVLLKKKNKPIITDERLQAAAALALARYMCVSARACERHLRLLFTVLEQSECSAARVNVLVACGDLVQHHPNLLEPWSGRLFDRLRDTDTTVRQTALEVLATLVLQDMLRPRAALADLALCLVDERESIARTADRFFRAFARKGNTIYNVLPDLVARLSRAAASDSDFRKTASFVVGLLEKERHSEPLSEKLCQRLAVSSSDEDTAAPGHLAFCLSLLPHSERSLRHIADEYPSYKRHLDDDKVDSCLRSLAHKYKSGSHKDEVRRAARRLEHVLSTGALPADDDEEAASNNHNTTAVAEIATAATTTTNRRGRRPKK